MKTVIQPVNTLTNIGDMTCSITKNLTGDKPLNVIPSEMTVQYIDYLKWYTRTLLDIAQKVSGKQYTLRYYRHRAGGGNGPFHGLSCFEEGKEENSVIFITGISTHIEDDKEWLSLEFNGKDTVRINNVFGNWVYDYTDKVFKALLGDTYDISGIEIDYLNLALNEASNDNDYPFIARQHIDYPNHIVFQDVEEDNMWEVQSLSLEFEKINHRTRLKLTFVDDDLPCANAYKILFEPKVNVALIYYVPLFIGSFMSYYGFIIPKLMEYHPRSVYKFIHWNETDVDKVEISDTAFEISNPSRVLMTIINGQ